MSTNQKSTQPSFSRNILNAIVGMIFPPLAALITAPILAHGLSVEGRGQLANATAPLLFVTSIMTFGLQESMTHHIAAAKHSQMSVIRKAYLLLAGLGLAAALCVAILAPVFSGHRNEVTMLIRVTSLAILPTFLVMGLRANVMGRHNWAATTREGFLFSVLRVLVFGGLFLFGWLTPLSASLATVFIPVLSALYLLPHLISAIRDRSASSEDHGSEEEQEPIRIGTLLRYGSFIWLGSLSGIILSRLDQVVLGPATSSRELAFYAIAVTIGELPSMIAAAVRGVVFSSDSADPHSEASTLRLQRAARLASFTTLLGALFLGATMWWWIPILFGPEYRSAYAVAWVLLLATAAGTSGSVAGAGLSSRGRPGLRSLGMAIAAAVNLSILLLTIRPLGIMGAGLATLAGALVAGNINVLWLKRHFGMSPAAFYGIRAADIRLIRNKIISPVLAKLKR